MRPEKIQSRRRGILWESRTDSVVVTVFITKDSFLSFRVLACLHSFIGEVYFLVKMWNDTRSHFRSHEPFGMTPHFPFSEYSRQITNRGFSNPRNTHTPEQCLCKTVKYSKIRPESMSSPPNLLSGFEHIMLRCIWCEMCIWFGMRRIFSFSLDRFYKFEPRWPVETIPLCTKCSLPEVSRIVRSCIKWGKNL